MPSHEGFINTTLRVCVLPGVLTITRKISNLAQEHRASNITLWHQRVSKEKLCTLGLVASVWDKTPTRFGACCHELHAMGVLEHTLGGARFEIWRWAPTPRLTDTGIIIYTLLQAENFGLLENMRKQYSIRFLLRDMIVNQKNIDSREVVQSIKGSRSPFLLRTPKRKARENRKDGFDLEMLWRDIISFA